MTQETSGKTRPNVLVGIASVMIIIGGLKVGRPILVPFMVATFLAVITYPLVRLLRRNNFSRGMAIFLVVSFVLGILGSFLWLLGDSAERFSEVMPEHVERLSENFDNWLAEKEISGAQTDLSEQIPAPFINALTDIAGGLASAISNLLVVMILLSFMLLEAETIGSKLEVAFGANRSPMKRLREYELDLQRYLVIKTIVSAVTGIAVGLLCTLMKVEFPLLLGVIAFLLNFVPTVGSILASIPAMAIAGATLGAQSALLVGGGYLTINMVIGNILEPQVMGRKLGLAPLVVVISLVFWGWVWGPVGMILSVPLTMALKIYLEHTENFQWGAILLGREPITPKLPPELET